MQILSKKMERTRYAVIGAGKGGHAQAGHIALNGYPVTLWNRSEGRISHLREDPRIRLEGKLEGVATLDNVTTDLAEALHGADVVSVMTTCDAYEELAARMAPHLQDGQRVLLNSAGIGGSLVFSNALRETDYDPQVIIGEADICAYGCKVPEPGLSLVKSLKAEIYFATLPQGEAPDFLKAIEGVYPQFQDVDDLLTPGFWYVASNMHAAGVILNAERIERGEEFLFYIDGFEGKKGEHLEALDQERIAVAHALGIRTDSIRGWLNKVYHVEPADVETMLRNTPSYQYNAFAPTTFQHRYLTEEVPTRHVPQLEMARVLGVPQPLTEALVERACELTGRDLVSDGRTLEKLGLTEGDIGGYSKNGMGSYLKRNGFEDGRRAA